VANRFLVEGQVSNSWHQLGGRLNSIRINKTVQSLFIALNALEYAISLFIVRKSIHCEKKVFNKFIHGEKKYSYSL